MQKEITLKEKTFTVLTGHVSPETAYVVDDYPYGYRLRCKIRYWVETKHKHGMRFCRQTTNPKRAGEHWNAPNRSTYNDAMVLLVDPENGHLTHTSINAGYSEIESLAEFITKFGPFLESTKEERAQRAWICGILRARETKERLTKGQNIFDLPAEERKSIIFESTKAGMEIVIEEVKNARKV